MLLHCRYLYLRNYTISVPQIYSQINRPALKTSSLATLTVNPGSNSGSINNYAYYIQTGKAAHEQRLHATRNRLLPDTWNC